MVVFDHEEGAEAAGGFPELFKLADALFGVADDAVVFDDVLDGDIGIGNGRVVFAQGEHVGGAKQVDEVVDGGTEGAVDGEVEGFVGGLADEDGAGDAPDFAVGFRATGFCGAFAVVGPVFGDGGAVDEIG